jgi:hypothetical protein
VRTGGLENGGVNVDRISAALRPAVDLVTGETAMSVWYGIVAVIYLAFLVFHIRANRPHWGTAMMAGGIAAASIGRFFGAMHETADFREVALVLLVYGITLLIVICEWLLIWGPELTEMWVKEIDYIYLLLGALGITGSVNRAEGITHRFAKMDIVGPAVLTTAIVFRLVKTRAGIGGWNKPGSGPWRFGSPIRSGLIFLLWAH